MTVYRLSSRRYPANDGLGASLYGGRWNHQGTSVIYAAPSRALCAFGGSGQCWRTGWRLHCYSDRITDELAITTVSIEMLHPDWNRGEPTQQTRNIGTEWVKSLRSAVLVVPSAIIPQEQNYVLNPSHPDFREIRFGSPEPFYFDDRLQKREGKRALR